MANIAPVPSTPDNDADAVIATWTFTNSDTPTAYNKYGFRDRTVAIAGTWGSSGEVTFEGSLDGTNYFALHDPFGAALVFTADGLGAVAEATQYIKPVITGADAALSVVATLLIQA